MTQDDFFTIDVQSWLNGGQEQAAPRPAAPRSSASAASSLNNPMGIHVNQQGNVWLCRAYASGIEASATHLGRIRMDENGCLVSDDLEELLRAHGIATTSAVVSTQLLSYQALLAGKVPQVRRWLSTTVALALEYSQLELATQGGDLQFLALHQEGRRLSLGWFDWGDGVLEVYGGNHSCGIEPFETMADALERLLDQVGEALERPRRIPVLCLADDPNIGRWLADAYNALGKHSVRKTEATLQLVLRDQSAVARGAALQSLVLAGMLRDLLLLEALPFGIELSFGEHRLPLVTQGTTIPTQRSLRISPQAGEALTLELQAFDERGLWRRYLLPANARQLESLAFEGGPLDVTVLVNANMEIGVELASGTWRQRMALAELSPIVQGQQPSLVRQPDRKAEASQDPAIDELIAALDDVDLGVRALSTLEQQSPAGAALLTVQQRLLQALAKLGVEHYVALGETFDPHRHEAFSTVSDATLPANLVVDELRRGFVREGRIIRYSLVQVANPR